MQLWWQGLATPIQNPCHRSTSGLPPLETRCRRHYHFLSSFDSSTPRSADQSAATPRRIVSSRIASAGGKKLAAEPGGAENYAANSRALNSGKCELWIQPCFACGGISRLSVEIANESIGCEEHVVSSKV